jgi:acyl-CoA synthetase (AMP-forming)/AMP-acid ligase II
MLNGSVLEAEVQGDREVFLPPLIARFVEGLHQSGQLSVQGGESCNSVASTELWGVAQGYRAALRAQGVARGDVLVLGLPTCASLLAAVLAAWAEGVCVALLPSEVAEHSGRLAPSKFGQMLALVAPAALWLDPSLIEHVPQALSRKAMTVDSLDRLSAALSPVTEAPLARLGDTAILQFTSGSTGMPKAAVITHGMLSANCAGIVDRLRVDRRDRMVSWLPLHHDMGLGAVTLAWWSGIDIVLLPTALFVRRPLCWLEAISKHRASLSPAPASAYALLARFGRSAAALGLDLSCWRYGLAGAEPVFHKHIQQFVEAMQPVGLRKTVVLPAYGLAESVVAVSMNAPGQPYHVLWVDAAALQDAGIAQLRLPGSDGAVAYVSNGKPLQGVEVEVRDETGRPVGQGRSGVLHMRGSSVIQRYLRHGEALDAQGWFNTGDVGFLHRDEVFISGRAKDLITRAGLNVSPHELEWAVEELLDLKEGSVAAFSCIDPLRAAEHVVMVVAKRPASADANELRTQIAARVVRAHGVQLDEIVFVSRSNLPKTTSGKIQRAALRSAYLRGELASVV